MWRGGLIGLYWKARIFTSLIMILQSPCLPLISLPDCEGRRVNRCTKTVAGIFIIHSDLHFVTYVARPDMRSIISSIIPPQRFFTDSLRVIVLTRNGSFEHGNEYNKKTAYLCGILNSMTFDFVARSKIQIHTMDSHQSPTNSRPYPP